MPESALLQQQEAVQYAELPVISPRLLRNRDRTNSSRLLQMCVDHGFFYLELNDESDQGIINDWRRLQSFVTTYFQLPLAHKMRDYIGSDMQGYKPAGTLAGAEVNRKDNFEALKIRKSGPEQCAVTVTEIEEQYRHCLRSFISKCEDTGMLILSRLSDALNLVGDRRFESHHADTARSTSFLGLLHYPPEIETKEHGFGHNKHTDIGSLTILFAEQPGLQVLTDDGWRFVRPKKDSAVINVGDSLRFLSGNKLKSCVHRVVPVQRMQSRYSVCYFLRPEDDAILWRQDAVSVTARKWHDDKYDVFRQPHSEQEAAALLTGGMEKNGVLVG